MFGSLLRRFRHGSYLKNEQGIKKFAERMMGELTRKVTKESANYREMNENLLVEKSNLRLRQRELEENDALDSGDFFSVRRRIRADTLTVAIFVVASIFMNVISVTALIEGDTALYSFMKWFGAASLALVLTGGGLVVAERFIESLFTQDAETTGRVPSPGTPMTVLWGALLIGILIATYGFSGVRAAQFASGQGAGALYLGFVTLAVLLPILAGAVRYDALRYLDVYKTTQTLREVEGRLAQIDSILRQNDEHESNFYKIHAIKYWDRVNDFKTHKDNYNEASGIVEALQGHFARSYDAFQSEASKRYNADIRDTASRSMRRFDTPGTEHAGHKLGQEGDGSSGDGSSLMMPASPSQGDGERSKMDEASSETYLAPQPVR